MITESAGPTQESFVPGLVSVIIPTYNRRELIIETLDSVAAQTYRPIEIIVVDDGSTDGTDEAVSQWFSQLDGTQRRGLQCHIHRQDNMGLTRSRNVGFCISTGEFIQSLDSDDLLHAEKIRLHVGALRDDVRFDIVYSGVATFSHQIVWPHTTLDDRDKNITCIDDYFSGNHVYSCAALYRRSIWQRVGGCNEAAQTYEDVQLHLRMIGSGAKVGYVPGTLIGYRQHAGPRVSRPESAALNLAGWRAVARVVDDHPPLTNRVRAGLADEFWRIALGAMKSGELGVARDALGEARKYKGSGSRRVKTFVLGTVLKAGLGRKFCSWFADLIFRMASAKSPSRESNPN